MTQFLAIGFNSARLWPSVIALIFLGVGVGTVMVGRMFALSKSRVVAKVATMVGVVFGVFGAYGLYAELPLLLKLRGQAWYIALVIVPILLLGGLGYLGYRWWQFRAKHKGDSGTKSGDGFYTLSQNG